MRNHSLGSSPQVFGRLKRSGGLCDSPLERGVGVCPLCVNNTPLQPHHRLTPSHEGNFVININLPNACGLQPSDGRDIRYIIVVPFMGRIVKVHGMALATFACLAKANIILHLTLTKVNGN
ncbi:MAG: hypothetical protein JWR76_1081 [Mucilaginibacter sp.]|nr:hypothetical protein [Mucilaginibacter sp.]